MGEQQGVLMINVDIYSFIHTNQDIVLMSGSLASIDRFTTKYENANELYEANKDRIEYLVKTAFYKENMYYPENFSLGDKGITLKKGNRYIMPLFKTIKGYKLQSILIKYMLDGNLEKLLMCDCRRTTSGDYDSIFYNFLPRFISFDVARNALKILYEDPRFYHVMRFLLGSLADYSDDEIYEMFCNIVPARVPRNEETNSDENNDYGYYYRYPYRD